MIDVLVVDDDFMVARIHQTFVDRTPGFTVVGTANTADEALQAAAEKAPDLVLLDVHLPDAPGLDVLGRLREVSPGVDVLVISSARLADAARRAVGGPDRQLVKPFGYEALRQRLEQYRHDREEPPG